MLWTFAGIPIRLAPGQVVAIHPRSPTEIGNWKRFFRLMANAIAIREGQPLITGVPFDKDELQQLADRLNVRTLLPTWSVGVSDFLEASIRGASHFLLQLDMRDPVNKTFQIRGFKPTEFEQAFNAYMFAEQSSPPTNVGEPPEYERCKLCPLAH